MRKNPVTLHHHNSQRKSLTPLNNFQQSTNKTDDVMTWGIPVNVAMFTGNAQKVTYSSHSLWKNLTDGTHSLSKPLTRVVYNLVEATHCGRTP